MTDACVRDRSRWIALFGSPAPTGTIRLDPTTNFTIGWDGHGEWDMTVPSHHALGKTGTHGPNLFRGSRQYLTLPHEMGHALFSAALGAAVPREWELYQDKPDILFPEWLSEAVAVWMEPDDDRAVRIANAAESFADDTLPQLADLLTQTNPARAEIPPGVTFMQIEEHSPCTSYRPGCSDRPRLFQRIRKMTFRSGEVMTDTAYSSQSTEFERQPATWFYGRSYALLAYIYARGGQRATQVLLDRVKRLQRDSLIRRDTSAWWQARISLLDGIPGLPASLTAIEADWRRWTVPVADSLFARRTMLPSR